MATWRRGFVLPVKDPEAVLDYLFDWTDWLNTGETIASATVTPEAGLVLETSGIVNAATGVNAVISAGIDGVKYSMRCKITTDSVPARVDFRTVYIEVATR